MRLKERCPCGGEIDVGYEAARDSYRSKEAPEAQKHIENFRRRHKGCLDLARKPQVVRKDGPNGGGVLPSVDALNEG